MSVFPFSRLLNLISATSNLHWRRLRVVIRYLLIAKQGTVVVIRGEGHKRGPGMPEMLTPTSAIMDAGLGKECALLTDGRFSGGSHGFVVGHICPEAQYIKNVQSASAGCVTDDIVSFRPVFLLLLTDATNVLGRVRSISTQVDPVIRMSFTKLDGKEPNVL
ncbi:hypothetical protein Bca4012_026206 [Brassica carinata]